MDKAITCLDQCIRTLLVPANEFTTTHPGATLNESPDLSPAEKAQIASFMRINHSGEICAQALYIGQSWTARDPQITNALEHAATEEIIHLAWCAQRLKELDAKPSYLNPLWFVGSLGIGILAGLAGDKVSLGFLHETENQVVKHLDAHLQQLPTQDLKSRAILEQMKIDEASHATLALQQGAVHFPMWVKATMQLTSKMMTTVAYYI